MRTSCYAGLAQLCGLSPVSASREQSVRPGDGVRVVLHGQDDADELELASDHLSMAEIAEVLSRALGTRLSAPDMTVEEAIAAGMPPMGANHEWLNVVGQPGRPRYAKHMRTKI
jgi:hypothetical protein